jgi:hypothetical protein
VGSLQIFVEFYNRDGQQIALLRGAIEAKDEEAARASFTHLRGALDNYMTREYRAKGAGSRQNGKVKT